MKIEKANDLQTFVNENSIMNQIALKLEMRYLFHEEYIIHSLL